MQPVESSADKYYGCVIHAARLDAENNEFFIQFTDGVSISIWDDGQSCCEERFMSSDDDASSIVGGTLTDISVKYAAPQYGEYTQEDVAFVQITTTIGVVVISNHNHHNGHYGGFSLTITEHGREDKSVYTLRSGDFDSLNALLDQPNTDNVKLRKRRGRAAVWE